MKFEIKLLTLFVIGIFALSGCVSEKSDLSNAHPLYVSYLALKESSSTYCQSLKIKEPCENTIKIAKQHSDLKFPEYNFQGIDILPVGLFEADNENCVREEYAPFEEKNISVGGPFISVKICGTPSKSISMCKEETFTGAHAFEYSVLDCCLNEECTSTIHLSVEKFNNKPGLLDGLLKAIANKYEMTIQ